MFILKRKIMGNFCGDQNKAGHSVKLFKNLSILPSYIMWCIMTRLDLSMFTVGVVTSEHVNDGKIPK